MTLKYIHIEQTDSTNAYLQRLQATDDINGCVAVACRQTAGKGMGSNTWESAEGQNLTFSIALNMDFLPAAMQFQLSKAVPLGILKALHEAVPEKHFEIKWPNDIYCEGHKIGGILINSTIKNTMMDISIIGIGLNVNQLKFHDWPTHPASLRNLTGEIYELDSLLQSICQHLEGEWHKLKDCCEKNDFSQLNKDYLSHLFRYHTWADYDIGGNTKHLFMNGVDPFGRLQLSDENGSDSVFDIKEIKFII